jgi:hypothetical protein
MALNIRAAQEPPPEPGSVRKNAPNTAKPKAVKDKPDIHLATQKEIEIWFSKTYAMIGTGIAPFKPEVAEMVLMRAEKCAQANAKLAMENPSVRRAISGMMVVGVWGAVIAAHAPILMMLAADMAPNDPSKRINSGMLTGLAFMLASEEQQLDPDEVEVNVA